jgi:hypothetical protein
MKYEIIIGVVVVILVAIFIWYKSEPKAQPTSKQTEIASMASLQDTMKAISTTTEGFDDLGFMRDPNVYKDTNIQNLAKNATVSMNLILDPKDQKVCTKNPTQLYELMNNIDSFLNQVFVMGIPLTNTTYANAIANLMLIRLTLVGIATYKKNYIKLVKNTEGEVTSVVVLPGLQSHIVSIIDKIFDTYSTLSVPTMMYVDENRTLLESQFNINITELKPKRNSRGNVERPSASAKYSAKNSIQSSFSRTIPVSTFSVVLVMLASRTEKPDCNAVKSS